ncbi:putative Acetyltransferase [Vibrio nigripulchritudo SO65]|uniref:GNAT family N-acetyltransferase n=1 Tax=Vibrio TaxID=662 RepID=UPI0003B1C449|nr:MULTISPECIES: GNAT family N-acetyltransferase [Vibrio]UAB73602.1 GNAT family N-acetyltransferase [Vibrio sp. SCSIO 43132]CCN35093.1 putative Acetyltransferase [Vibrio nigripulchritudo AM115]CCN40782.1 putative Acetyltransferase [Vibrio nigripulchritudo FTn2]CCN64409.1 putative Acetyltransferase [Vibrio nigripulchritudo POn4]CCN77482.1 putative Acetyltransferase [Vibrio nigripulchritudo SO65]
MIVCETDHLIIRHYNLDDANFIIQLLNEEAFIRYIGDRQIRTIEAAQSYLSRIIASYQEYGFGLNMVTLKDGTPIGMCGILKRAELESPDLGYALLSSYWGHGYAEEAGSAVLANGSTEHNLSTILAVTLPDNQSSNRLLIKLGFELTGTQSLYGEENNLYAYSS